MRRHATRAGGREGSLRDHDTRPTRRDVDALPVGEEAPPETAVCDFCTSAPARWQYPCRTFRMILHGGTEFTSVGHWGACDGCRDAIDSDQHAALLGKIILGNVAKGLPPSGPAFDAHRRDMTRVLALFRQHRLGAVEPYAEVTR